MHLRFEVKGSGEGLFQVLCDLRDDDSWIRRGDRPALWKLRHWLWDHTPAPGKHLFDKCAPIFWWVPQARDHQDHAYRACALLKRSGIRMRPIRAAVPPGEVVFRDDIQMAVLVHPQLAAKFIKPARKRKDPAWNGQRGTIRRWRMAS